MASDEFLHALTVGHHLFTAGRYFEAHEAWEAAWRILRGPERVVLHALVLWAAAYEQVRRGKLDGARRLLTRALQRFAALKTTSTPFLESLHDALTGSWERLAEGEHTPAPWALAPPDDATIFLQLEHGLACPSCGEVLDVSVDLEVANGAEYVEDCPVCCRSLDVTVRSEEGQLQVSLRRQDD